MSVILSCDKIVKKLWYIVIPVASVWSACSTCFHLNRGHQTSEHLSALMLAYESPSQSSLQNKALCVCQKMSSGLICGGQVDLFVPSSKRGQIKNEWGNRCEDWTKLCLANGVDGGPTLNQHWVNVSRLLGVPGINHKHTFRPMWVGDSRPKVFFEIDRERSQ